MKAQGRGPVSKQLRPMLRFRDDEEMAGYLETNKESNVGLYRRYGMELKMEDMISGTPVAYYAMVSHPQE